MQTLTHKKFKRIFIRHFYMIQYALSNGIILLFDGRLKGFNSIFYIAVSGFVCLFCFS